jgi:hypothetical protein
MNVEEFVRQMKEQHGESLKDMPLPEGVEDYLRDRIKLGDLETVIFMQKLAWACKPVRPPRNRKIRACSSTPNASRRKPRDQDQTRGVSLVIKLEA